MGGPKVSQQNIAQSITLTHDPSLDHFW